MVDAACEQRNKNLLYDTAVRKLYFQRHNNYELTGINCTFFHPIQVPIRDAMPTAWGFKSERMGECCTNAALSIFTRKSVTAECSQKSVAYSLVRPTARTLLYYLAPCTEPR